MMRNRRANLAAIAAVLLFALPLLSGCGILFGSDEPAATPTSAPRVLVPTFTPTPIGAATPIPADTATPAPVEQPAAAQENTPPPAEEATPVPAEEPAPEVAPTPTPAAKLIVNIDSANVRNGPGTTYGLAGAVTRDQAFDIIGKSPDGQWWKFCCVNGQEVWIFGELVNTENADAVAVVEEIPAPPPVAQAPAPAPAAPQPPPTEPPPPPQEQAPPPAADPCAGIGGDGCKFKPVDGPKFGSNGGNEIKLQLLFVHRGIDGGQPQGSYFVVMTKDGQKLPIADNVRSIAKSKQAGSLGDYNYEYKIGRDQVPGGNVAGNYTMYVLDGNGERDSRDISFTIPEGQGEVWLMWDQS